MGKSTILLVLAAIFSGGAALMGGMQEGILESERRLARYQGKVLAREIAYTGLNEAQNAIYSTVKDGEDPADLESFTGSYLGGSFHVYIQATEDRVTARADGTFEDETYHVRQQWDLVGSGEPTVPEFMRQAVASDGNFEVDSDVVIYSASEENASIHTNGNIDIKGGSASVAGFGYHAGNADTDNGQDIEDVFEPLENPSGSPVVQKVDELDLPEFKAEDFEELATQDDSGDVEISGTITLGTVLDPVIWFIEGNLKTKGNVTFEGVGVLLVKGNIEIEHHLRVDDPDNDAIGLYTNGNIQVKKGGLDMNGHWYANGNIELEDETFFRGTLATSGNAIFKGETLIEYRPVVGALANQIFPTESASRSLSLSDAREW